MKSLIRKMVNGATTGLFIGAVLGTCVTDSPSIVRGLKTVVSQHGIGLAAFGATRIGVDHLVQNAKMEENYGNKALMIACGLVGGYKAKNLSLTKGMSTAIYYVFSTSVVTMYIYCFGGQTTRMDADKEHHHELARG